jgi:putative transposase
MMTKISYNGYRFPPVIIQQAIWLYARFTLSFGDVEDLLAERGITVSYETVRRWVNHFGSAIAATFRATTGCSVPVTAHRYSRPCG